MKLAKCFDENLMKLFILQKILRTVLITSHKKKSTFVIIEKINVSFLQSYPCNL